MIFENANITITNKSAYVTSSVTFITSNFIFTTMYLLLMVQEQDKMGNIMTDFHYIQDFFCMIIQIWVIINIFIFKMVRLRLILLGYV